MAMDMKLDVGAFFKGLMSREKGEATASSPYQNAIIAGVLVVILIIAYGYFVYLPGQKEIAEKQSLINSTEDLRSELLTITEEILVKQVELQEDKYRYEELSRLFHDKKELEDLYRNISLLALTYELMVAKLEKGREMPVFKENVAPMEDDLDQAIDENYDDNADTFVDGSEEEGEAKKEVAFYKIMVKFEFSGNYLNYTYFRRDLAKQKKIINIEQESIEVPTRDENSTSSDGSVKISATLSTYRFPNSDAERYIVDDGGEGFES